MNNESNAAGPGYLDRNRPGAMVLAIFLVSVLGLYLEMLLIRWISTEIRIFAYLQNTVLVVCFLGLGMGCFTCRKPIHIRRLLVSWFVLTAVLAFPPTARIAAGITDLLSVLDDLLIWDQAAHHSLGLTVLRVTQGLVLTLFLMVLVWEMFVPLGRLLGRLMDDHPRTIWAYSVNVGGSLIGIWLFVLVSAFSAPPVVWIVLAAAMLVVFLGQGRERRVNVAWLAAIVAVGFFSGRDRTAQEVVWSPYQKLVLTNIEKHTFAWPGITVNNAGYQALIDLSQERRAGDPEMQGFSQYDVPLLLHPQPRRVLIVGAGAGNDAAGALRNGAEEVTAVEIDPAIIRLGRAHHPERPYDSPRVRVVNDDARAFFASSGEKFDLIIFGLLDSHTTTAMTNARLDHYVYTRESISRAKELLAENGVMVLSFESVKPYISDRMGRCIMEVFGQEPMAFRIPLGPLGWGGTVFVAGDQHSVQNGLAAHPGLAEQIAQWQAASPIELTQTARIATDDWPYIYLQQPRIPTLYFLLAGLLAALLVYGNWRTGVRLNAGSWKRSHWHFFFLGAAFLLLEVQHISKASVVLGNTWLVNAVIVSGVLTMILLANFLAARFPRVPQLFVGGCLIGSCLALYYIDLASFAFLPFAAKALLVGALTSLPMLFSGVIFVRSFARVHGKDLALGANLIGALVGALLQSVTFVIGIKALLLIVAGLYLAALLTRPEQAGEGQAPESPSDETRQDHSHEEPELVGAP